jgi:FkbM family methyltransferase
MIRALRNIPFVNRAGRRFLRFIDRFYQVSALRWKVSGEVSLTINKWSAIFFSDCDDPIVNGLYYDFEYAEKNDLSLFLHLAVHSKTILDIGAFTGLYSIFSAIACPDANVFAFEPAKANAARLLRNRSINRLTNLQVIEMAVGKDFSMVPFYVRSGELSDTSSAIKQFSQSTYDGLLPWKEELARQTSIDLFVSEQGIENVDLLKIDVENYEMAVFEGMLRTVQKFRPIILCEIFLDQERQEYFNAFYSRYSYIPYLVLQNGLIKLDDGLIPNVDGLNYLFSPFSTKNVYHSFKEMKSLIDQLTGVTNTK